MKKVTRITSVLERLREEKRKAFVPFITAGDPDLATTLTLVMALEKAGATFIELGVPFSDPMADGPVIQRSSERALSQGVRLSSIFELVSQVRLQSQIPIVLMGYYNPILQYGLKNFVHDAVQAGVDGVLIVDLPAEEAGELRAAIGEKSLDIIYLLAPTSDRHRMKLVNKFGSGFIYYVSLTGITGAGHLDPKSVAAQMKNIRSQVSLPVLVGFGISSPEQVASLAPFSDGVIVGSALVKLIEEKKDDPMLVQRLSQFVSELISPLQTK